MAISTCPSCGYHIEKQKRPAGPGRVLWNAFLVLLALTGVGLIAILFAWWVAKSRELCPNCHVPLQRGLSNGAHAVGMAVVWLLVAFVGLGVVALLITAATGGLS